MSKEMAIIRYRAVMAVVERWLAEGIIDEGDYALAEDAMARKYSLPAGSIYR
jgi:hypothetical protein